MSRVVPAMDMNYIISPSKQSLQSNHEVSSIRSPGPSLGRRRTPSPSGMSPSRSPKIDLDYRLTVTDEDERMLIQFWQVGESVCDLNKFLRSASF